MNIYEIILEDSEYPIPIKRSSDNIATVLDSNFMQGRVIGDEIVPIDSLFGTMSSSVGDARRVQQLAAQISGPNGYISRILVDPDGNVIEGQHRLQAIRSLGYTSIPITRIGEITQGFPVERMQAAVQAAQPMHREQVNQVVANVVEMVREVGSVEAALQEFELPRGYEAAFNAALKAIG